MPTSRARAVLRAPAAAAAGPGSPRPGGCGRPPGAGSPRRRRAGNAAMRPGLPRRAGRLRAPHAAAGVRWWTACSSPTSHDSGGAWDRADRHGPAR
ncbi:hypothetical protein G6F31_017465 [Rhizopus arrhizus]|nr:hypothetical protein G6F31_017465 [Rhizopus arrhizus]